MPPPGPALWFLVIRILLLAWLCCEDLRLFLTALRNRLDAHYQGAFVGWLSTQAKLLLPHETDVERFLGPVACRPVCRPPPSHGHVLLPVLIQRWPLGAS